MADIVAVRHVAFEHLGILEAALRARGHTVAYGEAVAACGAKAFAEWLGPLGL